MLATDWCLIWTGHSTWLAVGRVVAPVTSRIQVGDIKLLAWRVVLVLAGHTLVNSAGYADRTTRGVHQCWHWWGTKVQPLITT